MATADQALAILSRLARELDHRRSEVDELDEAYRGAFRLRFASDDFRDFFAKRYSEFSDNWCGIVADAPTERLEVVGIRPNGEDEGDAGLWDVWRRNDADALSDMAFLDAIVAKRSYALVWGDSEGNPTITWEHPSQAIVEYDAETRRRSAGAKIWADESTEYATLYLPDGVYKFQRDRRGTQRRESGLHVVNRGVDGGWKPRQPAGDDAWPIPNPLGVVPLVELPNRPRLIGEPMSDISGTLSMQHAINLLWAQLFLAADNSSWPQKVVTGAEMPTIPVLDEEGNAAGERAIDLRKFSLDRAVWIENPEAKVSEWSAAKLDIYTDVIEVAVGHIAAQTRTPAHYLLIGGTMANVSSDAMKALETGLVKRTEEKAEHFGRSVREVFRLVALVQDNPSKADSIATGQVLWKDIENRSDAQRTDALQKKKAMGYPMRYILELDGLPPNEIDRVMGMVDDEANDPILARLTREITNPTAAPVTDEATAERS